MKRYLGILLIATALLQANEEMIVDSGFAEYDGKRIVLTKDVVVEHQIGKITADKIILIPSEEEKKKLHFAFLEMHDGVKIVMKEGGMLECSRAELDYFKLIGKFYGNVIYKEDCLGKGNLKIPLSVEAQQMVLKLENKEDKIQVNRIDASQDVTIHYNQNFIAKADEAAYQRLSSIEETAVRIPGEIVLEKKGPKGICQITNLHGDIVDANQIRIDTAKRTLYCQYPNGVFLFDSNTHTAQEKVAFSSDTLIWDDRRDLLTMRDRISINQEGIGQLRSDREVQVFHHKIGGKRKVRTIESSGETVLEYIDPEKKLTHTLISYGKVVVDHEHCKTLIESPRNMDGNIPDGQQVFFSDRLGEIYADKVVLEYEQINGTLSPSKLILEGNVRLLNRSSVNQDETEAFLQYALADRVEFFPKLNEMKMSAVKPSRVLFFDKINNLQISAPGVKVKRDPTLKKEAVQGEGDVRFSFVDKELEKLKKHFALETLYKGKE